MESVVDRLHRLRVRDLSVYDQSGFRGKKVLDLNTFDAILIDIGNVIVYDFPVELAYSYYVHQEINSRRPWLAPTADDILSASKNPMGRPRQWGGLEFWEEVNSIAWSRVLDKWEPLCIPIPGAIEALQRLSRMRLVILANQPREIMPVIERLGIDRLVEETILDSYVGISKPDPAIYEYAARRLQTQPEALVMVGDRLDNDIYPAKALGMAAIWIRKLPLDETLPISFIPTWWKKHYFQFKKDIAARQSEESFKLRSQPSPDWVFESIADLVGKTPISF